VLEQTSLRHLYAGEIDLDVAARSVTVAGIPGSRQPPGVRAARHIRAVSLTLIAVVKALVVDGGVAGELADEGERSRCGRG